MILAYFILSHLIADFLLQPGKLVIWKSKSKLGALVHSLVHFAVNVVIFLPMIYYGFSELFWASVGISVVHFLIDEGKIRYDKHHKDKSTAFLIDQFLHLLTILAAYSFIFGKSVSLPYGSFYKLYTNELLIVFLILLIFLSNFVEVYIYQKHLEKTSKAELKFSKKSVFLRLLIFSIIYTLFVIVFFS